MAISDQEKEEIILRLAKDRRLAHATLFAHRHPQNTPEFHYNIIDTWHSRHPRVQIMAFRGGAKSTLSEEAIVLAACLQEFRNCIILGENEARANERLAAIKNEFITNAYLEELFGNLTGPIWQESKIVLANGLVIQAFGRGQSLRGAKHLQWRPDLALGDDMEDKETVETPEARRKFKAWFMQVVLPAMEPRSKIRIVGTPLDPQSWLMQLKNSPEWLTRVYPLEYFDKETGERRAMWPSRVSLPEIDKLKQGYAALGDMQGYMQEYMCEASDPASRPFTKEMIKVEPLVRTWQACYGFFDPARTTKVRSDDTGFAAWSWVGNRLVVWDTWGKKLKPDEIVSAIFEFNEKFSPVSIGVEETGLNEFILQPLRHEMTRRGILIPLKAMNAPKGKLDFIKGLQPFFKAGEVICAKPFPLLEEQLLSFPTGKNDVVNALAYALKMRSGQAVYDNFSTANISDNLLSDHAARRASSLFMALNADNSFTSGVVMQFSNGVLKILGDYVLEGPPGENASNIVKQASLEFAERFTYYAPDQHFKGHDTIGLRAAVSKIPARLLQGGDRMRGSEEIRRLLKETRAGAPCLQISSSSRWSLNGFSGGYARPVEKDGTLSDFAEDNAYKVLLESIESFAANMQVPDSARTDVRYARTKDGRQYITSRA